MGILEETTVSIKFYDFCKGQCAFELLVNAGRVNGLEGTFSDRGEEPVDLFFFGRRFGRIVVSHETTDLFKPVDMTGDIGAIDMAEVVDKGSEGFLTLF